MNVKDLYADDPNFSFQSTQYTCGPTTLLNILSARGVHSFSETSIAELANCTATTGTTREAMAKTAQALGLEVLSAEEGSSTESIEHHLDAGNTVVINYYYALSGEGHYAQVVGYDDIAFYLKDSISGYTRVRRPDLLKNWHDRENTTSYWMMVISK